MGAAENSWIEAMVAAGDPPHGTQSIRRAFLILRAVASAGDGGLGLHEIAMATGLARPTAHRFLSALVVEGAIEQRPRTHRYAVAKALKISGLTQMQSPLLQAAIPHLDEAAEDIGDTLSLTLRAGLDTVCVARRLGSHPIQVMVLGVGVRRPIGFSASGIALLASLPAPEVRRILAENRIHLRTNGATVEGAQVAVARARKAGYAFREKGIVPGTRAVSIAFGHSDDKAQATLTIAALASRMPASRVVSVVDRLRFCAAAIESSFGATQSESRCGCSMGRSNSQREAGCCSPERRPMEVDPLQQVRRYLPLQASSRTRPIPVVSSVEAIRPKSRIND